MLFLRYTNTVYEEPDYFIDCGIPEIGSNLIVSNKAVPAFQCRKYEGIWRATAIGKKVAIFDADQHYHHKTEGLQYERIVIY